MSCFFFYSTATLGQHAWLNFGLLFYSKVLYSQTLRFSFYSAQFSLTCLSLVMSYMFMSKRVFNWHVHCQTMFSFRLIAAHKCLSIDNRSALAYNYDDGKYVRHFRTFYSFSLSNLDRGKAHDFVTMKNVRMLKMCIFISNKIRSHFDGKKEQTKKNSRIDISIVFLCALFWMSRRKCPTCLYTDFVENIFFFLYFCCILLILHDKPC